MGETLPRPSSMETRPTTCSLTHRPLDSSQSSDLETQQSPTTLPPRLLPPLSHNSRLNQLRLSPALWSGPSSTPPRTPPTTLGVRATPDPLTPPPTWCQLHQHNSMQLTTEGNIIQAIFETNTGPSYSNESYDSVSRKPLDGFQNALHNKHIFIFGEVLTTNISLNITIYSTILINLSFFYALLLSQYQ